MSMMTDLFFTVINVMMMMMMMTLSWSLPHELRLNF